MSNSVASSPRPIQFITPVADVTIQHHTDPFHTDPYANSQLNTAIELPPEQTTKSQPKPTQTPDDIVAALQSLAALPSANPELARIAEELPRLLKSSTQTQVPISTVDELPAPSNSPPLPLPVQQDVSVTAPTFNLVPDELRSEFFARDLDRYVHENCDLTFTSAMGDSLSPLKSDGIDKSLSVSMDVSARNDTNENEEASMMMRNTIHAHACQDTGNDQLRRDHEERMKHLRELRAQMTEPLVSIIVVNKP